MSSGNDMLMSGGTPWAKWPTVGATVKGEVLKEPEARQSRDFDDNSPAFWDEGKTDPRMEVTILLSTAERDPDVPDDNGDRLVVLPKGSARANAVKAAVKASKSSGIEVGGMLTLTYVKDGVKQKGAKGFPPKEYSATYTPPTNSTDTAVANLALAGLVKPRK